MPLPNSSNNKKGPFKFSMYWMYAFVLLFIFGVYYLDDNSITRDVSYSDFEQYVARDHGITKIIVFTDKKEAEGYLSDSLASALFHERQYSPGSGVVAKVVTEIPRPTNLTQK